MADAYPLSLEALLLVLLTLLVVLGLTFADHGSVGTALRRWLVETPARLLARLSRSQALGLGLVVLLGVVTITLFETEGVRLFSMAAPDMVAWVLMFDVTVVFDMVMLAIASRAIAGWRGLVRQRDIAGGILSALIGRINRGARSRSPRIKKSKPPRSSGDGEPDPAFAFA